MNNVLNNLFIEIMDTNYKINNVEIAVPEWNEESYSCACHDDFTIGSYNIEFELITLRFNANDCVNNFMFFS